MIKISFLCSLYNSKIQVLVTNCAKSYLKTPKGIQIFFNCQFRLRMATITQFEIPTQSARPGSTFLLQDVTSDTQPIKTNVATFACRRREIDEVAFAKMPPSRCVLQDCDNKTDLDAGISIHLSPLSNRGRLQWKKLVDMHRKNFYPRGQFGICSMHFTKNCFTRTLHIPGTSRRLKC